ncbi:MAG: ferritin family protein [candidate division WOR-3 bacterium]
MMSRSSPRTEFYSPAEVVGLAVEIEKAGSKFYLEAAERAKNPETGELLRRLAAEEVQHERTFAQLFDRLRETPAQLPYDWEEVKSYLRVVTESKFFLTPDKALPRILPETTETELLELAIQFEKETLVFYLEIADLVAAEHRSLIGELVRQERRHMRKLAEMHSRQRQLRA